MPGYPPTLHEGTSASNERTRFAERLHRALADSGRTGSSATELVREFNARHPALAVTVHAAGKWLRGDAIPTQLKLRALADMLAVQADWLRYGADDATSTPTTNPDAALMADIGCLDEHHKMLAREFVRLLLRQTLATE